MLWKVRIVTDASEQIPDVDQQILHVSGIVESFLSG